MRSRHRGKSKCRAFARAERGFAVLRMKLRPVSISGEALAQDRLIDDAEHAPAIVLQRNQGAPGGATSDEGARAVDWIEHPPMPAAAGFQAMLLAKYAVVWPLVADERAHCRLGLPVCGGHRIECRLPLVDDVQPLAEIGP